MSGWFSASESGELDVPNLPRDIAARIERRAAEGRLFGPRGPQARYEVRVEPAPPEAGYRGAPVARAIVTLSAGVAGEIRLAIDGSRVRYEIAVASLRRVGLVMVLLTACILGAPTLLVAQLDARFAAGMIALGVAISLLSSAGVLRQSKASLRAGIEKMLREEAASAWWLARVDVDTND